MLTAPAATRPGPFESPLLGFLERIPPAARYAIAPLGRYTRACLEDAPPEALIAKGRRLLGFIDDAPSVPMYHNHPVAGLRDAAGWPLDAIILTRDTHDNAIRQRFTLLQREGVFSGVRLIDQPAQTLDAMLAHLGTYEPGCAYSPAFVAACRQGSNEIAQSQSTLLCTLDSEIFPHADHDAELIYTAVMHEFTRLFRDCGLAFTLCVQLNDTAGGMKRTPPAIIEDVLRVFGSGAIAVHGLDHSMPSDGYAAEWFESGLDELHTRYGVRTSYWAPPGWSLNWRTLRVLRGSPIRFVRGIWTGVNVRRDEAIETFRFPYRVGNLWQIPYAYVDWMFADVNGRRLDNASILPIHERLAEFAALAPCLIESVAHPFRLVGSDWRDRLRTVKQTLECYVRRGVSVRGVMPTLEAACS